jgi:uncharacterized protein involved in cysteine biosynthesis
MVWAMKPGEIISKRYFPELRSFKLTFPQGPHTAVFPISSILINAWLTGRPLAEFTTDRYKLPII